MTPGTLSPQIIRSQRQQLEAELQRKYPELHLWLSLHSKSEEQTTQRASQISSINRVHDEEYQFILTKMRELSVLPPHQFDPELALYLEQQLSEITGIEATSTLEGNRLLFQTGVIGALPHTKRAPTDTLARHEVLFEAGMRQTRSCYGWIPEAEERYGIALPLVLFSPDPTKRTELKKWFKYRKVVLVNPHEERAVIAAVSDIQFTQTQKYQFGGSPEVMSALRAWSPKTQGRTLLFFVSPNDTHPLGPVRMQPPAV